MSFILRSISLANDSALEELLFNLASLLATIFSNILRKENALTLGGRCCGLINN